MKVYNYVGVHLDEKKSSVVKNKSEAQNLFGDKIGSVCEDEYICDDSVVLKTNMYYSVVAEGKDTFVLKIKSQAVNAEFPPAVLEAITKTCLDRENRFRQRITAILFESEAKKAAEDSEM